MGIDRFFDEKIRFCVVNADDIQCSSTWFVHASSDSIYMAPSVLGGQFKLSVHPNRIMQLSTTRDCYERLKAEGVQGPFPYFRWHRPVPKARTAHRIVRLLFPADGLKGAVPQTHSQKPKLTFERPADGNAVEVGLFSSNQMPMDQEESLLKAAGYMPICRISLYEEDFTFAAKITEFDPALLRLDQPVNLTWLAPSVPSEEGLDGMRAIMIMDAPIDGGEIAFAEVGSLTLNRQP